MAEAGRAAGSGEPAASPADVVRQEQEAGMEEFRRMMQGKKAARERERAAKEERQKLLEEQQREREKAQKQDHEQSVAQNKRREQDRRAEDRKKQQQKQQEQQKQRKAGAGAAQPEAEEAAAVPEAEAEADEAPAAADEAPGAEAVQADGADADDDADDAGSAAEQRGDAAADAAAEAAAMANVPVGAREPAAALTIDGITKQVPDDDMVELIAAKCADGQLPPNVRWSRMVRGGFFLRGPQPFIELCVANIGNLRGDLGEHIVASMPVKAAVRARQQQELCARRVKFTFRAMPLTAEAVCAALLAAQVTADMVVEVCVFKGERAGFIEMKETDKAKELIGAGTLKIKLGRVVTHLKLSAFTAQPPAKPRAAAVRQQQQQAGAREQQSDDDEEKFEVVLPKKQHKQRRKEEAQQRQQAQQHQLAQRQAQPAQQDKEAPRPARHDGDRALAEQRSERPKRGVPFHLLPKQDRILTIAAQLAELMSPSKPDKNRAGGHPQAAQDPRQLRQGDAPRTSDDESNVPVARDVQSRVESKMQQLTRALAQRENDIKKLKEQVKALQQRVAREEQVQPDKPHNQGARDEAGADESRALLMREAAFRALEKKNEILTRELAQARTDTNAVTHELAQARTDTRTVNDALQRECEKTEQLEHRLEALEQRLTDAAAASEVAQNAVQARSMGAVAAHTARMGASAAARGSPVRSEQRSAGAPSVTSAVRRAGPGVLTRASAAAGPRAANGDGGGKDGPPPSAGKGGARGGRGGMVANSL